MSAERSRRITTLVDRFTAVRAVSPAFIQRLALGAASASEPAGDDGASEPAAADTDLTQLIASSMALDIEWPHVDRRFVQVFETLPGYTYQP